MIIKTFVGDTSAAALKQVRAELGGDAIVLKTRRVANDAGGYNIEVTACLDKPSARPAASSLQKEPATERKMSAPVWNRLGQRSAAPTVPAPAEPDMSTIDAKLEKLLSRIESGQPPSAVKDRLVDMDLPMALVNDIVATATEESQVEKQLLTQISSRLADVPVFQPGDRLLVFGPAGSGKTSVVSRLAAQLVTRKMKVMITGFNQRKVGAIDELACIADLIGVESPALSETAAVRENRHAVTIIDCGDALVSAEEMSALSPTHTIFVFNATMRTADLAPMAAIASAAGVTHVVMTMLDCTHRLGGLFAVCDTLGAGLCLISDSPTGIAALRSATAEIVVSRMLRQGATNAK